MRHVFLLALVIHNVALVCAQDKLTETPKTVVEDGLFLSSLPDQPGEDRWRFIDDLKAPLWTRHPWESSAVGPGQADLSGGVTIEENFPNVAGRLETAYADLRSFLSAGGVPQKNGDFVIATELDDDLGGEAFRVEIKPNVCMIFAGHADGIRRGIFHIEDEMRRLRGAFLPLGTVNKKPAVLRRISRCFFGPIKRPPKMTDELLDDVNYYPDQYLNRLAHEGINGLWLTIEFRDLVKTKYTPDAGPDAEKRLAKLSRTVDSCMKYGIRTYIFCIEPRRWTKDSQPDQAYEELVGAPYYGGHFFCPSSQSAHDYLYESVNTIFKTIPDLGGIINITHGERGTTCLSAVPATDDHHGRIKCSRCSTKEPWEILSASLSAMEKGMHDAAPDAELISWLYMPQTQRYGQREYCGLGDWVYDLPTHTPEGVVLQFNFESGVSRNFFGKRMVGGDYWISTPGPSPRFERVAKLARDNGTKVSAKIQTGNSHEVATTPYVPVPSLLYRKFAAMHELGVSHTMLCWYFGSYPGLMNKAAGLLSMEPFPKNEHDFLRQLAAIDWKQNDVPQVVKAWEHFSEGYQNYPLTNMFQYFGPMHDGPVWPLLLKPIDAPLSPTWQIGSSNTLKPWPPSGDRIGECIGETLTLEEVAQLAGKVSKSWDQGLKLLEGIEPHYAAEPERISDIGVAKALGIQFRSGHNILRFYVLREKMFRMQGKERLAVLTQLTNIIHDELENDQQLLGLCMKDSRLGFHSEAEGYKYFPEKIRWRMDQLNHVLDNDVPALEKTIMDGEPLFPQYTGLQPEGAIAHCTAIQSKRSGASELAPPGGLQWQSCSFGSKGEAIEWASQWDNNGLTLWVPQRHGPVARLQIKIETQRLHPCHKFALTLGKQQSNSTFVLVGRAPDDRYVSARIPWKSLGMTAGDLHPVRMDIRVYSGGRTNSWRPDNPITYRLRLHTDNPADLGWLMFDSLK